MRFMMMVKANANTEAGVMPTEEQFAEMGAYNEALIKAGVMKDGMGLQASSKGARIHIPGKGKRWVEDGPFAETKELIAGFWIIEVASKEEAIEWALKVPHPHFDDGETNIELRQIFEMEDFGESPAVDKMKELGMQ